jgi:hypothetical protein
MPLPADQPVQREHYDHFIGPVRMRYDLTTSFTFTDNRNYTSSGGDPDYGIATTVTVGGFYRISSDSALQVDFGVGYEWWREVADRNGLYLTPNSHLAYKVGIGGVDVSLSNQTSSSSEASDRPEYAGGTSSTDIAFNQVRNASTLGLGWGPGRLRVSGNYTFDLTRSLTDEFTELDLDRHVVGATVLVEVTTPLQAGLYADYTLYRYTEEIQNDGERLSVGPMVIWRPTGALSVRAQVGYAMATFEDTGTVADSSDFSGLTFDISAYYLMNRYLEHRLAFNKNVDAGYTVNYTDSFEVSYELLGHVGPKLHPTLGLRYERAELSGSVGEVADLFDVSLGVGYPVWRRLRAGATYEVRFRESNLPDRGYVENRVVLAASYQF